MGEYQIDSTIEEVVSKINAEIAALTGTEMSAFEKSFLREGILFARTQIPNHFATVVEAMEKLTQLESEYNYLIYTLISHLDKNTLAFRIEFDPVFASLTRAGRPNQAAVEAEALSKNDNKLQLQKSKLVRLESLINYLKTEVQILRSRTKALDAKRSNTY